MHESVERTEEGGVHLGQFTGKGYNINKEKGKGVHEGSIIRSQLEKNKNTTGHSEGPAGLAGRSLQGPSQGSLCLSSRSLEWSRTADSSELAEQVGQGDPGMREPRGLVRESLKQVTSGSSWVRRPTAGGTGTAVRRGADHDTRS